MLGEPSILSMLGGSVLGKEKLMRSLTRLLLAVPLVILGGYYALGSSEFSVLSDSPTNRLHPTLKPWPLRQP